MKIKELHAKLGKLLEEGTGEREIDIDVGCFERDIHVLLKDISKAKIAFVGDTTAICERGTRKSYKKL